MTQSSSPEITWMGGLSSCIHLKSLLSQPSLADFNKVCLQQLLMCKEKCPTNLLLSHSELSNRNPCFQNEARTKPEKGIQEWCASEGGEGLDCNEHQKPN